MKSEHQKNSISLIGDISMGAGVMTSAEILALTGQIAELAGPWFLRSFIAGGIAIEFSAYTDLKRANACPSTAEIAVILPEAYGSVQFRPTSRFSAGACQGGSDIIIIIPGLGKMLAEARGVRLHEPSRRERCGASAFLSIVAGC